MNDKNLDSIFNISEAWLRKEVELQKNELSAEGVADQSEEELHDFEIDGDFDETIVKLVKTVLITIGAIEPSRGTRKVYKKKLIGDDWWVIFNNLKKSLDEIKLELDSKRIVVKRSINAILIRNEINAADNYINVINIFFSLYPNLTPPLATKIGGIQFSENNFEAIKEKSRKEFKEEENRNIEGDAQKKNFREHEQVFYPIAEKILIEDGYMAITLGVNRRLTGEWNTPDVIGYKLIPLDVLGGVFVELVSIEVKWEISKSAIAEANSHQKLTHKSYIFVDQEIENINQEMIKEVALTGLGLICKKADKYLIHIYSQDNPVSALAVNDFLSRALANDLDAKEQIQRQIAIKSTGEQMKKILQG